MSGIICFNKGNYNIYSNVSDSFLFESSIDIKELYDYVKETDGTNGLNILPVRLKRAHDTGTSCMLSANLEDTITYNRAGTDEKCLSFEACITIFLS